MTTTEQSYTTSPQLAETLKKYQQIATFVGVPCLAALIAGYFFSSPEQFFRSYLVGMWFWFGMSMGCLALLMVHMVSGGAWGAIIRRHLEAGARTVPVMWLCFLPILIFPEKLYTWADPAHANDKIVLLKHLYLNVGFLRVRWLIYGVVWCGLSLLLNKLSKEEDETKSWKVSSAMEKWSAPGIVAYFLTITFASVDFLMSLDVSWASTIYGFLIAVGQGLSAMCLVVAVLTVCMKYAPMDHAVTSKHLHDLGKLMLALVMLWAYLSFSQYLIIYSANLPQEITWYIRRLNGGWEYVGLALLLLHFALPFALLLSQTLKKNPRTFVRIAIFILFIRVIDVFWLVEPNFQNVDHPIFTISWLDIVAPLGFGGIWLAMFFYTLPTRPLMPLGYPDLQKALNHGREH
jgi:hypothetical protein